LSTTRNYDQKIDIWSVGCIIYYLFVGIPPFFIKYYSEKENKEQLKEQANREMGIGYSEDLEF